MTAVYLPGDPARNEFGQLLLAKDPLRLTSAITVTTSRRSATTGRSSSTRCSPAMSPLTCCSSGGKAADIKVNEAVPKLFSALIVSVIAVAVILILPPLLLGTRLPRERSVRSFLLYFLAIGAGYILIEVALIQKFVLFLGHPTYALTVVIFSMLVSSGLGSYLSRRIVGESPAAPALGARIVAALVAVVAATMQPILAAGVGLPFLVKMSLTVLMIAPARFRHGHSVPHGSADAGERHAPSVRWAWSLNAAASVLGR